MFENGGSTVSYAFKGKTVALPFTGNVNCKDTYSPYTKTTQKPYRQCKELCIETYIIKFTYGLWVIKAFENMHGVFQMYRTIP